MRCSRNSILAVYPTPGCRWMGSILSHDHPQSLFLATRHCRRWADWACSSWMWLISSMQVWHVKTGSGQTCYTQFLHIMPIFHATGASRRKKFVELEVFVPVLFITMLTSVELYPHRSWNRRLWKLCEAVFCQIEKLSERCAARSSMNW